MEIHRLPGRMQYSTVMLRRLRARSSSFPRLGHCSLCCWCMHCVGPEGRYAAECGQRAQPGKLWVVLLCLSLRVSVRSVVAATRQLSERRLCGRTTARGDKHGVRPQLPATSLISVPCGDLGSTCTHERPPLDVLLLARLVVAGVELRTGRPLALCSTVAPGRGPYTCACLCEDPQLAKHVPASTASTQPVTPARMRALMRTYSVHYCRQTNLSSLQQRDQTC